MRRKRSTTKLIHIEFIHRNIEYENCTNRYARAPLVETTAFRSAETKTNHPSPPPSGKTSSTGCGRRVAQSLVDAHTPGIYGYPVRAVRGSQVVNRGTVEEPRQTPRNLHYLRLQRSPLCRKWGSLLFPPPFYFFSSFFISYFFFFFFFLSLSLSLSFFFLLLSSLPSSFPSLCSCVPRIRSILRPVCLSETPSTEEEEEEDTWPLVPSFT